MSPTSPARRDSQVTARFDPDRSLLALLTITQDAHPEAAAFVLHVGSVPNRHMAVPWWVDNQGQYQPVEADVAGELRAVFASVGRRLEPDRGYLIWLAGTDAHIQQADPVGHRRRVTNAKVRLHNQRW